jgi:hypothetical protein
MEAIARRQFIGGSLLLAPLALWADTRQEINAVLASMATDLSNANASGFMKAIDKEMPGYGVLRQQIIGLIDYAEISTSVEIQSLTADGEKQIAKLDWYLTLRNRGESTMVTNKRDLLTVEFAKQNNAWRVIRISPPDFFTPEK